MILSPFLHAVLLFSTMHGALNFLCPSALLAHARLALYHDSRSVSIELLCTAWCPVCGGVRGSSFPEQDCTLVLAGFQKATVGPSLWVAALPSSVPQVPPSPALSPVLARVHPHRLQAVDNSRNQRRSEDGPLRCSTSCGHTGSVTCHPLIHISSDLVDIHPDYNILTWMHEYSQAQYWKLAEDEGNGSHCSSLVYKSSPSVQSQSGWVGMVCPWEVRADPTMLSSSSQKRVPGGLAP